MVSIVHFGTGCTVVCYHLQGCPTLGIIFSWSKDEVHIILIYENPFYWTEVTTCYSIYDLFMGWI